ncbi:MAG: hypothetical protein ACOYL5_08865, partial [Phototrophicaceae bacterium]
MTVPPNEYDADTLDADSRYLNDRPRLSWTALWVGIMLGGALAFAYTWWVNPATEINTRPVQLEFEARAAYMAAVTLAFSADSDLGRATERLLTVTGVTDPFQALADTACQLAQSGYANSTSGLRSLRSMMTFYQLQGRTGCADTLIGTNMNPQAEITRVLPTPSALPPPTKTPTPAPTLRPSLTPPPVTIVVPTSIAAQQYVLVNVATFCDVALSGIIEVYVQTSSGIGIPGEPVRVRWEGGEDTFYTGLKPERGAAYADFQMTPDESYTIEMPNRAEPSRQQLIAAPCTTENG